MWSPDQVAQRSLGKQIVLHCAAPLLCYLLPYPPHPAHFFSFLIVWVLNIILTHVIFFQRNLLNITFNPIDMKALYPLLKTVLCIKIFRIRSYQRWHGWNLCSSCLMTGPILVFFVFYCLMQPQNHT